MVALARTMEHLLKTMTTFHAALHARVAQAHAPDGSVKRGAQTVKSLVEVGRRIAAVNFTFFWLAVGDVLRNRIVPLAMAAQRVEDGAWAVDQKAMKSTPTSCAK